MILRPAILIVFLAFIAGFQCKKNTTPSESELVNFALSTDFDASMVESYLNNIADSPHPLGSQRQKILAELISNGIQELGLSSSIQPFTAQVPNPLLLENPNAPSPLLLDKEGFNVLGFLDQDAPCTYLIGSHYDSKYMEDLTYRGANDSGSSSAALLAIAKILMTWNQSYSPPCGYTFVWFDGEEAYLPGWNDGTLRHPAKSVDNTYGSRFLAQQLVNCQEGSLCLPQDLGSQIVKGLVLLDMIGSPNIKITKDGHSTAAWLDLAISLDDAMGFNLITGFTTAVEDDHIPFKRRGLPVLNLIDFNHLQYWHKAGDDVDTIDMDSIEKASRLAIAVIISLNQSN